MWATLSQHQIKGLSEKSGLLLECSTEIEMEKVHLKFCKMILGVKRNCSTLAALGELGELPVTITMISRMITYWHRVATLDEDNLTKKAYSVTTSLAGEKSDWFSTVRSI